MKGSDREEFLGSLETNAGLLNFAMNLFEFGGRLFLNNLATSFRKRHK